MQTSELSTSGHTGNESSATVRDDEWLTNLRFGRRVGEAIPAVVYAAALVLVAAVVSAAAMIAL